MSGKAHKTFNLVSGKRGSEGHKAVAEATTHSSEEGYTNKAVFLWPALDFPLSFFLW